MMDNIKRHVVQIAIKHISPLNVKHIKCVKFLHQLQASHFMTGVRRLQVLNNRKKYQKPYVFYFFRLES